MQLKGLKKKDKKQEKVVDESLANDYQLSRAVDLVKALSLYGSQNK